MRPLEGTESFVEIGFRLSFATVRVICFAAESTAFEFAINFDVGFNVGFDVGAAPATLAAIEEAETSVVIDVSKMRTDFGDVF